MSFAIEIASVLDRDDLVAEIWWDGALVAEINSGIGNECRVDIYPTESGRPWSFALSAWVDILNEAKRRLK